MNYEEMKSNLNTLNAQARIDELEKLKAEIRYNGLYNEQIEDLIDKNISLLEGNKK